MYSAKHNSPTARKNGARDAILYYALSWISGLNQGFNIGMYCSDVQGAFDKVDAELLICKLASFNFVSCILEVISNWLRNRSAFVIVNEKRSYPLRLRNIVFQSTVWGPTPWNVFLGTAISLSELVASTWWCTPTA